MICNHQYINTNYKVWVSLVQRANQSAQETSWEPCEFLYRRALAIALEHAADWFLVKPERSLGMVVVSYQNLAGMYGQLQMDHRQVECLLDAYNFLSSYMNSSKEDGHGCLVASNYLEIIFADLATYYEKTEQLDDLEHLLWRHQKIISEATKMEKL